MSSWSAGEWRAVEGTPEEIVFGDLMLVASSGGESVSVAYWVAVFSLYGSSFLARDEARA